MQRATGSLLVAVVALLVLCASAQAGTIEVRFHHTQALPPEPKGGSPGSISVYRLTYTAAAGEANDLTITGATGTIVSSPLGVRMSDAGAPLSAGQGCAAQGAEVVCTVSGAATIERFDYDTGDGNDKVRMVSTSGNVQLGPGGDSLTADLANPQAAPAINADGGAGADTFGANVSGALRVMYTTRATPVTATLDGEANDGEAGEGDQLGAGVGGVDGGSAPDTITGGPSNDTLRGGPGDDTISGLAGDDSLSGEAGDDRLEGGEGAEIFAAEPGADLVHGGPGEDSIRYFRVDDKRPVTVSLDDQPGDGVEGENDNVGSDVERLLGGQGDDHLIGNDGPNEIVAEFGGDIADGRGGDDSLVASEAGVGRLIGGAGRDSFAGVGPFDVVESRDGVAEEIVCREAGIAEIDGDPTDTGSGCIAGLRAASENVAQIRVDRRGVGRLRIACGDIATTCRGTVRLMPDRARVRRATGPVLARARAKVSGDAKPLVRLKLTRRALRYVRSRRSVTVTASFSSTRTLPVESGTHEEFVRLVPRR